MRRRNMLAALAVIAAAACPIQASAMEETEVAELAIQAGEEFGICPELLQAVAWKESSYREDAQNGGCIGLMQVSECWHRERMERLGVTDLYDPEGNMRVAADYLSELFERFEDSGMVLMVYNGDSSAYGYQNAKEELSGYASSVLEKAQQLERAHGK